MIVAENAKDESAHRWRKEQQRARRRRDAGSRSVITLHWLQGLERIGTWLCQRWRLSVCGGKSMGLSEDPCSLVHR